MSPKPQNPANLHTNYYKLASFITTLVPRLWLPSSLLLNFLRDLDHIWLGLKLNYVPNLDLLWFVNHILRVLVVDVHGKAWHVPLNNVDLLSLRQLDCPAVLFDCNGVL